MAAGRPTSHGTEERRLIAGSKRKLEEEDDEVFTQSGDCEDEVTFVFDDKQKLFVSQNFLGYASPVFKAMFRNHFKERSQRQVRLPGKKYEDFLEFLLCLHPNKQKPVEYCNVLRLVRLADEYQSSLLTQKCKAVMLNWLQSVPKETQTSFYTGSENTVNNCRTCIQILTTAVKYQYEEVVSTAVDCIARYGFGIFSGIPRPVFSNFPYKDQNQELIDTGLKICKELYDQLPEPIKLRLLTARLNMCDSWTKSASRC